MVPQSEHTTEKNSSARNNLATSRPGVEAAAVWPSLAFAFFRMWNGIDAGAELPLDA